VCGFLNVVQLLAANSTQLPPVVSLAMAWCCCLYSVVSSFVYARYLVHAVQRSSDSSRLESCSLGSLMAIYAQSVLSFAALYLTMILSQAAWGSGDAPFNGLSAEKGWENIIHVTYFSAAIFSTAGTMNT
jgi:hypothetical protein